MGISGHILGDRKLRWLNRETGMDFDRAFRYHEWGVGRRLNEAGECEHYHVDFRTWEVEQIEDPTHWTSCPRRALLVVGEPGVQVRGIPGDGDAVGSERP